MRIGILGGGQLARMILENCYKFGFEFQILSNEENSPAGKITRHEIVGDWNDENCLSEFANSCDLITAENEFIDFYKIKFLENLGKEVHPGSEIIQLIQDKFSQKQTLRRINIPVANFESIQTIKDLLNFAEQNGYPIILKSRTMGYDGKGNYQINSEKDIEKAFDALSNLGELMCESFVHFNKEIATQVVRNKNNEVKVYPIVETIQKNHICNLVIASKNLFENIRGTVENIAKRIVNELNYIGVMGIEMFLKDNNILVNELAPRVHNSGHYTIEGCYISQFENHMRAITNLPLGNIDMTSTNAVMINIIGDRNEKACLKNVDEVLNSSKTYLHIYGKEETRIGRKMGHITVLDNDLQKAIETANYCREKIHI